MALAGSLAGIANATVSCPVELLMVRMMTQVGGSPRLSHVCIFTLMQRGSGARARKPSTVVRLIVRQN